METDVLIVGAGITGIYTLYRLREHGLSARVIEKGTDVGGTWYWNRYPGARCDTESLDYSFSFDDDLQQEWRWPEKHSKQGEILRYLQHVADRFDLRGAMQFETTVETVWFDEDTSRWHVSTDRGEFVAKYLILATGFLSVGASPDIPGLKSFNGNTYFTSNWPQKKVEFSGRRVGLIGTGSSGVQVTPVVAAEAGQLTVFQRTAGYTLPAWTEPIDSGWFDQFRTGYRAFRDQSRATRFAAITLKFDGDPRPALEVPEAEREEIYERAWRNGGLAMMLAFPDIMTNMDANRTCADFLRGKIRQIVKDPAKARKLLPPESLPFGCKRPINDNGYYEAFNRGNVDIVSLADEPIAEVTADGLRTTAAFYPLDDIILATGFVGMTGALSKMRIVGRGGLTLDEAWRSGPRNYLGQMAAGFPNLFMPNGPFSVGGNTLTVTEMLMDWIVRLIEHAETENLVIDVTEEAQDCWVRHTQKLASQVKAIQVDCRAWWSNPDFPGITLIHFGGAADYFEMADDLAEKGYRGFKLSPRPN